MNKNEFNKKYHYTHDEQCCWTCKFSEGYKDCLRCFNPNVDNQNGIETEMSAKCDLWKSNKKDS